MINFELYQWLTPLLKYVIPEKRKEIALNYIPQIKEDLFRWAKIDEKTGCIEYNRTENCIKYNKTKKRYATFCFKRLHIFIHRLSFLLHNKIVPDQVRHICDNKSCINPKHLVNGTHAQNMADKKGKKSPSRYILKNKAGKELVEKILKLHKLGVNNEHISGTYKISLTRVGQIIKKSLYKNNYYSFALLFIFSL
jgi:hypothetical protein